MRKDYIDVSNDNTTEIEFIEQYWSDIWKNEGGPKNKIEKILNKPEYKIMKPYLKEIKSKIKFTIYQCMFCMIETRWRKKRNKNQTGRFNFF